MGLLLCAALLLCGCNGSAETTTETSAAVTEAPVVNVDSAAIALTVNGVDVSLGSYIFYKLAAKTDAYNTVVEQNPDLTELSDEALMTYSIDGVPVPEWISNKTYYYCKQLVNIEQNFDKLGLTLTEQEIANTEADITNFWTGDDQRLSMFYGLNFATWGAYYASLGIDYTAFERACYASTKQVSLFNYYYGENGSEKSSTDDINAYMVENYAVCQYIVMQTYSFIPESEILRLANEYAAAISNGTMTVAQAKEEYLYYFNQQSILDDIATAEKAGTEYTGDSVDSVKKTTVADDEVSFVIEKGSDKPTKAVEAEIFKMEYNKPQLFTDGNFYYLIYRTDITNDASLCEEYLPFAQHALNDIAFKDKFSGEIENAEVAVNQEVLSTIDNATA